MSDDGSDVKQSGDTERHERQSAKEMTVVEMVDAGMDWDDIAKALGTDVDEAMARYRNQAYKRWNLGWDRDAENGQARFESGAVDLWVDADASVQIEEVANDIPLTLVVDDGDARLLTEAGLTADQARELAATLCECADILEGEK